MSIPLLFYFIYISLTIFITIALINILTGPFLRQSWPLSEEPSVSVLVPARNEAHNIGKCLESLRQQQYPDFEILVLDDDSQDDTARIVSEFAQQDPRIRLYQGTHLPEGWTGKNWACHQLSERAKGTIFIFTDADNQYHPSAIKNTIGWMQKYHLAMFSAFPQQKTTTFFEKLVIPVIDLILYGSLVLWLTWRTRFASLAAANGQWLAFRSDSYRKLGGHASVRREIVEDVELSRLAKRKGLSILTTAGTGVVYGQMYHSWQEVWQGFTKNLFGLVSNKILPFFSILIGMLITYILPYILLFDSQFRYPAALAVGLNMLLRFLIAVAYRHPRLISTILHPLSILVTIAIGVNSFRQVSFGMISWKGREIRVKPKS